MEHYITEIKIKKLRHLKDISIKLNLEQRQHLLLTGKNGSGKTSLLLAMVKYLTAINKGELYKLKQGYIQWLKQAEMSWKQAIVEMESVDGNEIVLKPLYRTATHAFEQYRDGIDLEFQGEEELDARYAEGEFITAFFPANRSTRVEISTGVEDIKLGRTYDIKAKPGELLHKYMVHLKTQQAYARTEYDPETEQMIEQWFERFENALRVLFDDESIRLRYDYKRYDFLIEEEGREPFGLNELSDGYSSVINIVSDLILRMDQNWLLKNELSNYNKEGIVLIDELETHLHIELQKKIMPFLTTFFPRIQFIVTTHSPYILGSIKNAKAYDLEHCIEVENMSDYSAESIAENYFDVDAYSDRIKQTAKRYLELKDKADPTDEERAERAELRSILKESKQGLAREILNDEFIMEGKGI